MNLYKKFNPPKKKRGLARYKKLETIPQQFPPNEGHEKRAFKIGIEKPNGKPLMGPRHQKRWKPVV
jgi:hypothetical protein